MEGISAMMVPLIGSVGCIKGEIHSIVTIMRLNTRWGSATRFSRDAIVKDSVHLLHLFRALHERLEGVYDIREVDCVLYLQPFLEVISSESTSGSITSVALTSIHKFLSYGFLTRDCPRAKEGVNLISKCVSTCVFEETDSGSDEVVLMKLLELAVGCISCDASHLLTVRTAWELYETCYMIGSDRRASKLMKSKAETVLAHLTLSLFSRANQQQGTLKRKGSSPNLQPPARPQRATVASNDVHSLEKDQQSAMDYVQAAWDADLSLETGYPAVLARIMSLCSGLMQPDDNAKETVSLALGLVNIALEAGGPALSRLAPVVAFLKGEMCRNLLRTSHSSDLEILSKSLRVVFNLFSSIKNHMKVQLEVFLSSVHLRLLQSVSASVEQKEVVLESLVEFCREPALMHDLYINYDCDVRCTSLFDAIMTELCRQASPVELTSAEAQKLRQGENVSLEDVIPEHLQGSIDKFKRLKKAHENDRNSRTPSATTQPEAMENQADVVPFARVDTLNRLAVEGVLAVQHSIARRCFATPTIERMDSFQPDREESSPQEDEVVIQRSYSTPAESGSDLDKEDELEPWYEGNGQRYRRRGVAADAPDLDFLAVARARTAEVLRQRRIKKQRYALAADKFNSQPGKLSWLTYAQELGLLQSLPDGKPDPRAIAQFLKSTPGLSKSAIGEFLSKGPVDMHPLNAAVLREYVETFDFSHMSFDEALRNFLAMFRLPGEAQCIDRLMEAFANQLFTQVGPGNPFANADAAFILAFSTIMLNTDLHNPQIQDAKRMKLDEFIRNNKGINGGKDLPTEFLESLYHKIKTDEIQVQKDLRDVVRMEDADFSRLENLLNADNQNQLAAASFTPTITARKQIFPAGIHEKDMFMAFSDEILVTMLKVWTLSDDNLLLLKILEGIQDYARICAYYKMADHVNSMVQLLISQALFSLDKLGLRNHPSTTKPTLLTLPETGELLLLLDVVENLQTHNSSSRSVDAQTAEKVLTLVSRLKCPLILYTVFMLCTQHIRVLGDAWRDLVDLILALRKAHVLPASLLELDDFADARGNPLPPSIFMQQCVEANMTTLNLPTQNRANQVDRAPSSGSTILNPLWWLGYNGNEQPQSVRGPNGVDPSSISATSFNDDSWLYEPATPRTPSPPDLLPRARELIRSCLDKCRIDSLLFQRTKEVDLAAVCILVDSILECVVYMDPITGDFKLCQTYEIDCVLALEWVARIIIANRQKAIQLWPHLHSILDFVLDSRAALACKRTPYLVERCIITVLRAGIHMLDLPEISSRVWESLRLLRSTPVEIARFISDRLGAGLLTLIKVAPHNQSNEEQWYLLFSLLGAAASGKPGRPFVWEAISNLIDHNAITQQNFMPARHLVLRFLHGVFPGEGEEELEAGGVLDDDADREAPTSTIQPQDGKVAPPKKAQSSNPWVTGSLILLLRLMLMILKGLQETAEPRDSDDELVTQPTDSSVSHEFHSIQAVVLDNASTHVVPIWFDTVKICAEFTSVSPAEVSKNAAYCLQVLIRSATEVRLSPAVWGNAIGTLLAALPLSLTTAAMKPSSFSRQELELMVLRNCEVVLSAFLEHFTDVVHLEDFQSLLLRLVSTLATNYASSDSRSNSQVQFYGMLLLILRRFHNSQTWSLYTSRKTTQPEELSSQAAGENTAGPVVASTLIAEPTMEETKHSHSSTGTDTTETSMHSQTILQSRTSVGERDRQGLFTLVWKVLDSVAPSFRTKAQQQNPEVVMLEQEIAGLKSPEQAIRKDAQKPSPWNPQVILASLLDRKAQTV